MGDTVSADELGNWTGIEHGQDTVAATTSGSLTVGIGDGTGLL